MKVFLGGTCNGSLWREALIPGLIPDGFNPVVADWTPECQAEELRQRAECDLCLYLLTPRMTGFYAIAELIEDAITRPHKTVFAYLVEDGEARFDPHQIKSLAAVGQLVQRHTGRPVFTDLEALRDWLNRQAA